MTDYAFRSALLRGKRTYRLERGCVSALDGRGTQEWRLDLRQVDRAVFVDFGRARKPMRRLDLFGPDGLRRISINTSAGGMEEDRAQFAALCAALCRDLAEVQPEAAVEVGEYGAARIAMLAVGLIALLGGLGLLIAAAATAPGRLAEASVPIGVLILFGGAVSWGNRPGQPRPRLPAEAMAAVIESLDKKTV